MVGLTPQLNSHWMLAGSIARGWTLSRPLWVAIESDDDGSFLVSDSEFAVYGQGETPEGAMRDYVVSLIEYYQLLESRAKQQDPTKRLFTTLAMVLRKDSSRKDSSAQPARDRIAG
jgi:hypothetical protein